VTQAPPERHDPLAPHGRELLEIAEQAVRVALAQHRRWAPDPSAVAAALAADGASFVTLLDDDGALLGCIGTVEPRRPLAVDVAHHAIGAAFEDPRLPPLTHDEFERMTIEVSVLSALSPTGAETLEDLAAQLVPGVDGLVVEAGERRATFLPAVWEKVDGVGEFLEHLWAKAGLVPGTWPDGLRTARYATRSFHALGPRAPAALAAR
jgi:AmmeMemoRadiSam system protein A